MIWYPYAMSTQFPELGTGGRTIMAGPVYHFDPALNSSIKLPAYYDDTLFIYEWSRNWIKEVKLDANGNILKINPFAADISLKRPMDMALGPDGALYVLEWGTGFNGNNADAQLVRIEFLGTPQIVSADFNDSGFVDGADFLAWQRGQGIAGGASRGDGDANVDGRVDGVDLEIWDDDFGTPRLVARCGANCQHRGRRSSVRRVDRRAMNLAFASSASPSPLPAIAPPRFFSVHTVPALVAENDSNFKFFATKARRSKHPSPRNDLRAMWRPSTAPCARSTTPAMCRD